MFESLNSIAPHAKSGAVRGARRERRPRSPAFPDLPTVAEAGVPGYSAPTWSGVIGPAGMPQADRRQDQRRGQPRDQTQAFKDRFGAIGDEPAGGTPEEFAQTIKTDLREMEGRGGAFGREAGVARDLELDVEFFQLFRLGLRRLDPLLHERHRQ